MTLASLLLLLASVALSIRGVGLSKWVLNCGAVATFVIVALVLGLSVAGAFCAWLAGAAREDLAATDSV